MKIIMINASPRENGSTSNILHIIEHRLLEKENIDIEFYDLSKLQFSYCKGCNTCFQTTKCILQDDLEKLSQTIVEADGIIIGTPTYASNVSGQLKTLIDRGHFIMEQGLYKKYALGVITGENYGASSCVKVLQKLFAYSGAYTSSMISRKISFSHTVSFHKKDILHFEKKADLFYRNIKQKRSFYLQNIKHYLIFNFGIKPFVLKKGIAYQGIIKKWKSLSLLD